MEFISIASLKSVNSLEKIQVLNGAGIYSVRDMAEFEPCRHAELIMVYAQGSKLKELDLENYIEVPIDDAYLLTIAQASMNDLIAIKDELYDSLHTAFLLETINELAEFAPYIEAKNIIKNNILGDFYEKPSAPSSLLPKIIGSTHTQVKFSNYVKEQEKLFDGHNLSFYADSDEPDPASAVIEIFYQSTAKFYLGYLGSVKQQWINMGTHLGEPIHSVALAPGESRNIAVVDWYNRQQSKRGEDTSVMEELKSEFIQTRALNEVVQTTANEHLAGGTEIDANTKTTGYGLVGGLGGGKAQGASNTSSGSANLMGPLFGMLVGAGLESVMSEGMVSSMAGSLGGSLVHSKGTVQGTLKSETSGDREVMGEVTQNINDLTIQNSSNVRSLLSTVIVEDRQSGGQRAQTKNITNYNHSHALTMQYYEVLQTYRTKTAVDSLTPVLFLPFKPIDFDIEIVQQYWYLFGKAIKKTHPKKFKEYSQVVKDYNPDNTYFDATGNIRISQVKITKTKTFTSNLRVELYDSDPVVTLAISGSSFNEDVDLSIKGAATYVTLNVLSGVGTNTYTEFNGADSFEIDENITARINSQFKTELEETMKVYLDDENKVPKSNTEFGNLEDNEVGISSNRNKLKQQVDEGKYRILNGGEELELTFNIEYTLADENDQEEFLLQTLNLSYTFSDLYAGFDSEVTNITDFVNTQLTTITDINPTDVIEEIENHFRFHKYGYTKYLLAYLEKEQIIDVVEHLGLSGGGDVIPLSSIVDPNPLGITENLLIFKLKDIASFPSPTLGKNFNTVITSGLFDPKVDRMGGRGYKKPVMRDGNNMMMYHLSAEQIKAPKIPNGKAASYSTGMTLYIDTNAANKDNYPVEGQIDLITFDKGITRKQPVTISGKATQFDGDKINISYKVETMYGEPMPEDWSGNIDVIINSYPGNVVNIRDIINNYQQGVSQYEEQLKTKPVWSTVFLPTAGVFGEAILGISNASEYINLKRFWNWQDSPPPFSAPAISPVNVNQDYSQPISTTLNPNVPVSVLNQMSPVPFPGTSLDTALQAIQNGSMFANMSNSGQLVSTLGTLAQLANNTAQLSGSLAGNAAANSLNAAVELGKQVASMIGNAMNSSINNPPSTPTAIGGALGLLDTLSDTNPTPNEQAQAAATGTPIPPKAPSTSGGGGTGPDGDGNGSGGGGGDTGESSSDGGGGDTGTSNVIFDKVEMKIESVQITGGERFSESIISLFNFVLGFLQVIPEAPEWVAPEAAELFRPYSTLEVKGTLSLRDPGTGMVVEQKNFSIKSTDAFAFIKNDSGYLFDKFNTRTINLITPIYSLSSLDGTETITAFANIDPVSTLDLLLNTVFAIGTGTIASMIGADEINIGGWIFSIAEYSALMSNAVFHSNNGYSQSIEYFTNLRESWTERDLAVYINNKSDGFQYISPVNSIEDICFVIPTSPPDLVIY